MSQLDKNNLIMMYKNKMIREHKIPTALDIDQDYYFPSYKEFKKTFNGKQIREVEELSKLIKKYKLRFKIDEMFCEDCLYNKKNCGKDIEECKKKGELYFNKLNI